MKRPSPSPLSQAPARALVALCLASALVSGCATSKVVNLSHYDPQTPDFVQMRNEGIIGVIHEATYPPGATDPKYGSRQDAAFRAGMLWGAYHFGNGSDPIRQADQFVNFVASQASHGDGRGILMILDFEQNTHYPGGNMTADQAAAFIKRIHERTGQYPGFYSNENRLRSLGKELADNREAGATIKSCWLWVANYHHKPHSIRPWGGWRLWQYTGDGVCDLPASEYPTSAGNVRKAERNIFRGSDEDLASFWQQHAYRP